MKATNQGISQLLVVDDEQPVRRVLSRMLEAHGYGCSEADGFDSAVEKLAAGDIAMVLTDLDMPGRSGLELLAHLKERSPQVAVVIVTGRGGVDIGKQVVASGAYGYLTKPVRADDVLVTVFNALRRRELEESQRNRELELEGAVAKRTEALWAANIDLAKAESDLRGAHKETVERLAFTAEHHDDETGAHVRRMSRYTEVLARGSFDEERAATIGLASVLHDLGKIAIPDAVLRKRGRLSPEEMAVMRTHAEVGYQILKDSQSEVLQIGAVIARSHHEWFDGSGYPHGLSGQDIPVEGRLAAIADVYDALSTDRVYRKAFSLRDTIDMMKSEGGTHFDPILLDTFLDHLPELLTAADEEKFEGTQVSLVS